MGTLSKLPNIGAVVEKQLNEVGITTAEQRIAIQAARLTNEFWGTTHFHRPLSFYLNAAAKHGFTLKEICEPVFYDGVTKNNELPLFFFAEFIKK